MCKGHFCHRSCKSYKRKFCNCVTLLLTVRFAWPFFCFFLWGFSKKNHFKHYIYRGSTAGLFYLPAVTIYNSWGVSYGTVSFIFRLPYRAHRSRAGFRSGVSPVFNGGFIQFAGYCLPVIMVGGLYVILQNTR